MQELNKYIEHTILKPDATQADIQNLVNDALEYKFFGVCINLNYIKFAKELIGNNDIKIVTVVNFPLANNVVDITKKQTELALEFGADEIDTVVNISELKNKNYKVVENDIIQTKASCKNNNLKVILETDLLTKDEIKIASEICANAGANFVKTSTGFVKNGVGAKVEDVEIMYKAVSSYGLGVKASGGIRDYNGALALIKAGATRLGTSSGVEIIKGSKER